VPSYPEQSNDCDTTDLHDFTGGSDGQAPYGPLAIDSSGNIYGVVSSGSSGGYGAVFEITP